MPKLNEKMDALSEAVFGETGFSKEGSAKRRDAVEDYLFAIIWQYSSFIQAPSRNFENSAPGKARGGGSNGARALTVSLPQTEHFNDGWRKGGLSHPGRIFFPVRAWAQGSLLVGRAFWPSPPTQVAERSADFFWLCFYLFPALRVLPEGHFKRYFTCCR